MQKALNGLSPTIRETFLMVFQEGRTCREVADLLQVPIGTVLSRTDSGRKALRAALGRNGSAHKQVGKNNFGSAREASGRGLRIDAINE